MEVELEDLIISSQLAAPQDALRACGHSIKLLKGHQIDFIMENIPVFCYRSVTIVLKYSVGDPLIIRPVMLPGVGELAELDGRIVCHLQSRTTGL